MTNTNQNNDFQLWPFLLGIVSVVIGLIVFANPLTGAGFIIYLIAFMAIFRGLMFILIRNNVKKATGESPTVFIILGVLNILIGIFILFNVTSSILALPFVFAIWFIADSLVTLFNIGWVRKYSKGRFWFTVLTSILGIILGVLLIYNPWASILTIAMLVGIYFVMNGIIQIVSAF